MMAASPPDARYWRNYEELNGIDIAPDGETRRRHLSVFTCAARDAIDDAVVQRLVASSDHDTEAGLRQAFDASFHADVLAASTSLPSFRTQDDLEAYVILLVRTLDDLIELAQLDSEEKDVVDGGSGRRTLCAFLCDPGQHVYDQAEGAAERQYEVLHARRLLLSD